MKKFKFDFKRETDEFLQLIESLLLSFFIVILLFTYLFQISTVDGESMEDTLKNNEHILSRSLFYEPKTGDTVVIEATNSYTFDYNSAHDTAVRLLSDRGSRVSEETVKNSISEIKVGRTVIYKSLGINQRIVKRVIATEGQRVKIDFRAGNVFVDGEMLDEPYIKNITVNDQQAFSYPFTVPKGFVFVLGDNRFVSKDSRHPDIGLVSEESIVGKVIFRLFPVDKLGIIH